MQIKKRYFVVALLLLLGLTTFTFANPNEEMGSKKTAKGISETVTNDKIKEQSYSEALEAVEEAEENPTVETVEAAREEIRNANDATEEQVTQLQNRVDVAEETIDVAALVKEVETLAEVKETRETAREKYPNAESEVKKLDDGNVKDNLGTRLAKVSRLLNDTNAPEITGVNEKKPTKDNVTINVSDEFLSSVKVNDKEYSEKDFTTEDDLLKLTTEVNEEGAYTVIATDKLGNSVTKTFTIDKTAPGRVYSTVRVNKKEYEENKVKYYYVKNGDSFEFAMQFTEELKEAPVVKIAGREIEMKLNETVYEKESKVLYEGTFKISENEKELKQGLLEIKVSNIIDLAGNETTDPLVLDQTKTSNGRSVIYDCKNPVIEGVNNKYSYNKPITIKPVDYIVHNVSPVETATIDGEPYEFGTSYAKEGAHEFVAYDRAGNRVRVKFTIDMSAPKNSYVAIISKADNYKYAKNGDTIRFLVAFDEEVKLSDDFIITFNGKTKKLSRSGDKTKWEYIAEFKIPENEEKLKEGLLTFEVKGFADKLGNLSTETLKVANHYKYNSVTYDRTPPELNIDYRNNDTLTDIVASDANELSFEITGAKNHSFDSKVTTKRFSINWLGVGKYTVVAKDAAGNKTTKEAEVHYVSDSEKVLLEAFKNGGKAILTKNITLDSSVELAEGTKLEIDLNGYELKISNPEKSSTRLIQNKGELAIKNGNLENEQIYAYGIVDNYGTLTLDNVKVQDNGSFDGSSIKNRNGKVTITNSEFNITSSTGYKTEGEAKDVKYGNTAVWNDGELVIKNTKITGDSDRAYALTNNTGTATIENVNAKGKHGGLAINGGTVTINDMKYESDVYYGIYVSNKYESNVTINGGEFIGQLQGILLYNEHDKADVKVTINGGKFSSKTGKEAAAVSLAGKELTHKLELVIKGGTFVNTDVTKYVADGYIQNKDYEVVSNSVSVTTATQLKELFADAKNIEGKTIVLEKDLDMTGIEWKALNGVSFTLDGAGHTIKNLSYTTDGNVAIFVNHSAAKDLTFKNLTIDNAKLKTTATTGDLVAAGFFVGDADTIDSITIQNCTVKNSTIEAYDYAGGFVGYAAGYNVQNDGPVYGDILIEDCSFINNTITSGGSVGGAVAHAGGNPDTTVTVKNFKAENNVLNGEEGRDKTGIVIGTAHVGKTILENITQSNNAVLGEENSDTIYGRFVPNSTGTLTIDGQQITQ